MRQSSKPIIYNRLAALRNERGLSRHDLANALGLNYQMLGYLEREEDNPDLDLALRISEYFAVPLETIFSRKPFQPLSEEVYGRNM